MAISCTFSLNNKEFSVLGCAGVGNFVAFSGKGAGRNNPASVSLLDFGALPPGTYYIIDRQSGGTLGALRDFFNKTFNRYDKSNWFALYRSDGVIDDETYVQGIKRGNFRIHPQVAAGISKGCITLLNLNDFTILRDSLKRSSTINIPGSPVRAYGTVTVQ